MRYFVYSHTSYSYEIQIPTNSITWAACGLTRFSRGRYPWKIVSLINNYPKEKLKTNSCNKLLVIIKGRIMHVAVGYFVSHMLRHREKRGFEKLGFWWPFSEDTLWRKASPEKNDPFLNTHGYVWTGGRKRSKVQEKLCYFRGKKLKRTNTSRVAELQCFCLQNF